LPGTVTHTASLDKVKLPAGTIPKQTIPSTTGGGANTGNPKLQLPAGANPKETIPSTNAGNPKLQLPAGANPKETLPTAKPSSHEPFPGVPTSPGGQTNAGNPKLQLPAGVIPPLKETIPTIPGPSNPNPSNPGPSSNPTMPHYPGGGYGGGVVVIAPELPVGVPIVEAPVAAPMVQMPVASPSAIVARPARTAVASQQMVRQEASCGTPQVPRLAAMLDELLSSTQFEADLDTVKALRLAITDLDAAGQRKAARTIEERAMGMLGYAKHWFGCGSFTWINQAAAAQ
jgi:hypothetical protein